MSSIASAEKFSVLVILRREYLEITNNYCAAKLIEYFRHWTKWKMKNHRTPWVYQPLKRIYADLMGEHSLHVIRAAIALLDDMGILEKKKNPGNGQDRTWQYKLHFDVLNKLLEHGKCKTERGTFNAEQYHRNQPQTSKPQQHSAVEFEKSEELENEILECDQEGSSQTPESELPQITHYVDEPEQDDSTNEIDHHEDKLRSAVDEAQLNVSKQEIVEVCNELRRLRINPQPCLGVVKKYWVNVQGAIAVVKEAVQEGWCKNPTGLFINSCKSGTKGKNTVTAQVDAWFSWAYKQRIVGAMSGGVVYTPNGEPVDLQQMMKLYPYPQ